MRSESAEDLADLVRDEDEAAAVVDHLVQDAEEVVDLVRRQHGGRLVEDEERDVSIERLDDLDPLALADGELPDDRVRVDVEPVPGGELADAPGHDAEIGERPPCGAQAEGDVLAPPSACSRA